MKQKILGFVMCLVSIAIISIEGGFIIPFLIGIYAIVTKENMME